MQFSSLMNMNRHESTLTYRIFDVFSSVRHLYFPCIRIGVGKGASMFIVFFFSAVMHEMLISVRCHVLSYTCMHYHCLRLSIFCRKNICLTYPSLPSLRFLFTWSVATHSLEWWAKFPWLLLQNILTRLDQDRGEHWNTRKLPWITSFQCWFPFS